jgi:hypothetical protein
MSGYRANSEPRSKQAGRERVQDGRLPRKTRVRVAACHDGGLLIDLPDEHDPVYISKDER